MSRKKEKSAEKEKQGSATILVNGDEAHTAGSRKARFTITNMPMERFKHIMQTYGDRSGTDREKVIKS